MLISKIFFSLLSENSEKSDMSAICYIPPWDRVWWNPLATLFCSIFHPKKCFFFYFNKILLVLIFSVCWRHCLLQNVFMLTSVFIWSPSNGLTIRNFSNLKRKEKYSCQVIIDRENNSVRKKTLLFSRKSRIFKNHKCRYYQVKETRKFEIQQKNLFNK